jgi:hypothetical protein
LVPWLLFSCVSMTFIRIVFVSIFLFLFIRPNLGKVFLIWISSQHQDRMNQVLWKRVDVVTSILKWHSLVNW